jgi:hypothetical protein
LISYNAKWRISQSLPGHRSQNADFAWLWIPGIESDKSKQTIRSASSSVMHDSCESFPDSHRFPSPGPGGALLHGSRLRGRCCCSGVSDEFGPRECFDWADRTVTLSHVAVAEYLSAAGFDVTRCRPGYCPAPRATAITTADRDLTKNELVELRS